MFAACHYLLLEASRDKIEWSSGARRPENISRCVNAENEASDAVVPIRDFCVNHRR